MGVKERIRQNYKEESEALVNKQINMEFYASYVYMSMFTYFDRDDVAFPGLASFFKKSSDEEREHGEKLIKYQNKRGGKVVFQDIAKPSAMEWGSAEFLDEQVDAIKEISSLVTKWKRAGPGLGHHMLDKEIGNCLIIALLSSLIGFNWHFDFTI